jgi:hypothetical protein
MLAGQVRTMPKTRRTPTRDELREASKHIHYELAMVIAPARHLATTAPAPHDVEDLVMVANAMIDATAIHARALFDFAYEPPNVREDDIIAADYIQNWSAIVPPLPAELKEMRERANKVAHLSYVRKVEVWKFRPVLSAAVTINNLFVKHVKRDLLDEPTWRVSLKHGPIPELGNCATRAFNDFGVREKIE